MRSAWDGTGVDMVHSRLWASLGGGVVVVYKAEFRENVVLHGWNGGSQLRVPRARVSTAAAKVETSFNDSDSGSRIKYHSSTGLHLLYHPRGRYIGFQISVTYLCY
jgi:hypothetical protein